MNFHPLHRTARKLEKKFHELVKLMYTDEAIAVRLRRFIQTYGAAFRTPRLEAVAV